MDNGKGIKKTLSPTIFVIVLAFIASAVLSVVHVRNVRQNLADEINDQYIVQLQVAANGLSDNFATWQNMIDAAAFDLEYNFHANMEDEEVHAVLTKYRDMESFSAVTFFSKSGYAINADGKKIDTEGREKALEAVNGSMMFIADDFFVDKKVTSALFVCPVKLSGATVGYVVGAVPCSTILTDRAYSNLTSMGDMLLLQRDGNILDEQRQNGSGNEIYGHECEDLSHYMVSHHDVDGASLSKVITGVFSEDKIEDTIECSNALGKRYYLSYVEIGDNSKLLVAGIYSEDIYSASQQEVVRETVVTVMTIMLIMVLVILISFRVNHRTSKMVQVLAYEDEITGGHNLNYFKEFAKNILTSYAGMPFLVHRFDISNFRYINEAYGHDKADKLLRAVIEEANETFGGKELCARMTADQFVMLTKNTHDLDDKLFVFTDKVNARALDIGIRYPIKFKRGVYAVASKENDIDVIIDKANAARKELTGEEKESVCVYSEKMLRNMRKVDQIESEMESALFNHEFKMFIQPKWDIIKDRLYGGEALVRWFKEDGTMVYPSDFVPVFEKNGFVEQLDMFMLESACKMIRGMLDAGKDIYPISVNQSRLLLHNPDYIKKIAEIFAKYEVPEGAIELEITETVFFMEREKMFEILNELKRQKVEISMDDFGSGYSSLNMLKDFPFDVLKIDKEFFSESITSDSSTWILRKIVEMAHGLGIRVICEGVETKEQVNMLKSIGVRYVQGYYYSKPIPHEKFLEQYCDIDDGAALEATIHLADHLAQKLARESARNAVEDMKKFVEKRDAKKDKKDSIDNKSQETSDQVEEKESEVSTDEQPSEG